MTYVTIIKTDRETPTSEGGGKLKLHYTSYVKAVGNQELSVLCFSLLVPSFLVASSSKTNFILSKHKNRMLWVVGRVEEDIFSSLCSPTGLSHILHKHAP